jgi:hypothetical protein
MPKTLIASADRQALTGLLQGHLAKRTAGLLDKDSEFITKQVIEDHKDMMDVLQNVLDEDKKEAFAPNDPLLD